MKPLGHNAGASHKLRTQSGSNVAMASTPPAAVVNTSYSRKESTLTGSAATHNYHHFTGFDAEIYLAYQDRKKWSKRVSTK
jgi:hypothetical protein